MLAQADFVGRNLLPDFLNRSKMLDTGVEIGTHQGEYAQKILETWKGQRLVCVDPWLSGYSKNDPTSAGDRQKDRKICRDLLDPYVRINKCEIWETTSIQAAKLVVNESLDFVYIDGNHEFQFVAEDVHSWWPKVKPGGFLCGHDIICPGEIDGGWGKNIQRVVLPFVEEMGLTVYLIIEETATPWSYYIQKPNQ